MLRNNRKTVEGTVIRNKMDKTIVVEVVHSIRHPKYEKLVQRRKKYFAHDEKNALQVGDVVNLVESRPYSKKKRWRVIEK